MRLASWVAGAVACVTLLGVGAALVWGEAIGMSDAPAWARGGTDAFDAPERAPGAWFDRGFALQASGGGLYVGTGLVAGRVRVQWAGDAQAATLVLAQLASPIHRATECGLVGQLRRRAWIAGASLRLVEFDFGAAAPRSWRATPAIGVGWHVPARGAVLGALQVEDAGRVSSRAAWIGAAQFEFAPGAFLCVQRERVAGDPARSRAGIALRAGGFDLSCGYDASAHAHTVGAGWKVDGIGLAWGARTHPDLGWSHVWTGVVRR